VRGRFAEGEKGVASLKGEVESMKALLTSSTTFFLAL
jgi:hypothetical protein